MSSLVGCGLTKNFGWRALVSGKGFEGELTFFFAKMRCFFRLVESGEKEPSQSVGFSGIPQGHGTPLLW